MSQCVAAVVTILGKKSIGGTEEVIISRLLIKAMPRTGTETILKFNRDLCKKIKEINL